MTSFTQVEGLGGAGRDALDGGDPTPPAEEKDEALDFDQNVDASCSNAKGCP